MVVCRCDVASLHVGVVVLLFVVVVVCCGMASLRFVVRFLLYVVVCLCSARCVCIVLTRSYLWSL